MSRPSVQTARDDFMGELRRVSANLKRLYTGSSARNQCRLTPYERAERRVREACPGNNPSVGQLTGPHSSRLDQ